MNPPTFNPVHFGREVIDQFGRYLMTTFPIADERLEGQVRERVRHGLGGERLIAKCPYIFLNRPFERGPSLRQLAGESELSFHPAMTSVFPFESLHRHQEPTLRAARAGRHGVTPDSGEPASRLENSRMYSAKERALLPARAEAAD